MAEQQNEEAQAIITEELKPSKTRLDRYKASLGKYKKQIAIVVMAVAFILGGIFVFHMLTASISKYLASNAIDQAKIGRQNLLIPELKKEKEFFQKQQIITTNIHDVYVVTNAADTSDASDQKESFSSWANDHGFDSIIIGRIQEPINEGMMMYATFDGQNRVPFQFVLDKLKDKGCTKTVSFMFNRNNFDLPWPIVAQTNGPLRIYNSEGIKVAGFALSKDKLRVTASNFDGYITDNKLSGKFQKPWDAK
jgi:hypothetical protein